MSLALEGRYFTTEPPEKPPNLVFEGWQPPLPPAHTHTLLTSGGLCPISLTAEIPSWRHCWIPFTFPSHPEGSVGLTQNHGTEWMGLEQELQSHTEVTESSPGSQSFLYPRRAACSRHSINIYWIKFTLPFCACPLLCLSSTSLPTGKHFAILFLSQIHSIISLRKLLGLGFFLRNPQQ